MSNTYRPRAAPVPLPSHPIEAAAERRRRANESKRRRDAKDREIMAENKANLDLIS